MQARFRFWKKSLGQPLRKGAAPGGLITKYFLYVGLARVKVQGGGSARRDA